MVWNASRYNLIALLGKFCQFLNKDIVCSIFRNIKNGVVQLEVVDIASALPYGRTDNYDKIPVNTLSNSTYVTRFPTKQLGSDSSAFYYHCFITCYGL